MKSKERPFVLFVAEIIYQKICEIKKKNPEFSKIDAIDNFIGSKIYNEISSGKFHEEWFKQLEKDNYIDKKTRKIPEETLKLLKVKRYNG